MSFASRNPQCRVRAAYGTSEGRAVAGRAAGIEARFITLPTRIGCADAEAACFHLVGDGRALDHHQFAPVGCSSGSGLGAESIKAFADTTADAFYEALDRSAPLTLRRQNLREVARELTQD